MPEPIGIYVHVPFCRAKCSYCDFYSVSKYEESDFGRFVSALRSELKRLLAYVRQFDRGALSVASVYFGGGTPTVLPPACAGEVLAEISESCGGLSAPEISWEANPESLTEDALCKLKMFGVNRISLGVQSFQDQHLRTLGRLASRADIFRALKVIRSVGFVNFGIDLIYGTPGQTLASLEDDLSVALEHQPKHISAYNLTLASGHPMHAELPHSDLIADMYERIAEVLEAQGFSHYEISNFAIEGFECRHNRLYWTGGDFLGIGPSAASRIFRLNTFYHRKSRSDLAGYLGSGGSDEILFEPNSFFQTLLEAVYLELRKKEGIELREFRERYGYDILSAKKCRAFLDDGFLLLDQNRLKLSRKGLLLGDYLASELVPCRKLP